MKAKIKTGFAALVLLLAISCKKENTPIQSSVGIDQNATTTVQADINERTGDAINIGTQVWKKKDLVTSFYRNGDKIPEVKNPAKWSHLTTGAWCWYNNNPANGKLYNWYAVNDPRGLAPQGWHVPSDSDWTTLTTYLGGLTLAGGKMKETGTIHWLTPNADATNSSGFTALPGGTRYYLGSFFDMGGYGYWWSSTESDFQSAHYRYLTYFYGTISGNTDYKLNGFSIRCIKD